MRNVLNSRRRVALLAAVLAVCLAPAQAGKPNQAPDRGVYGANDGPVFLLITLAPDNPDGTADFVICGVDKANGRFANECDELGSQMVLVPVGRNVAGPTIGDTTFQGSLANIPVDNLPPNEDGTPRDPETLDQNAATIIGSFCTFGTEFEPAAVHFTGPDPAPVDQEVQEAFFLASAQIEDALAFGDLSQFPTTAEFAFFVYTHQGDAGASFPQIEEALFRTDVRVNCSTCSAETDILPHNPPQRIFTTEFEFDPAVGDVDLTMFINIACDLKPGNSQTINLGSNGVFPLVFLTEDRSAGGADVNFDATDIDTSTIELFGEVEMPNGTTVLVGPILIDKSSITDIDGDGDNDLLVHFRTDLLEQAVLPLDDDALMFVVINGRTNGGQDFRCRDSVRIVPPNK